MNLKVWLPFALAASAGILAGMQYFNTSGDAGAAADRSGPATVAAQRMPTASPDALSGFSFAGFLSAVRPANSPSSAHLQAAFQKLLTQPPGDARSVALQQAYARWLLDAPADAIAQANLIPAEERRAVITAALAAVAHKQPANLQPHAAALGLDRSGLADVMGALAEQHPVQALDWLRQHPQQDAGGKLSAAVLPALIRHDVALAARTVAGMKETASLALIQQVATAYARQDPAQAYAWTASMIASRADVAPARLLDEVSSSLAAGDQQSAAHFMTQTDDPAIRKSLMSELAIRKGQDDLAGAYTWLTKYSSDPGYPEVAQNLLYRWSYAKPQEVARILPQLSDPALQASAAAHLTQLWQRRDPLAYQQWLASLPSGALRTAALAAQ